MDVYMYIFVPNFSDFNNTQVTEILLYRKENLDNINTLTANYEYSRSNGENLPLPIQLQSSKKPKAFCWNFIQFLEFTLNFECFEKKIEPHSLNIS